MILYVFFAMLIVLWLLIIRDLWHRGSQRCPTCTARENGHMYLKTQVGHDIIVGVNGSTR